MSLSSGPSATATENQLLRKTLMKDLYTRISMKSEQVVWNQLRRHPQEVQRARDLTVEEMLASQHERYGLGRSVVRYSQKQVSPLTWPGDDAGTQGAVCKSHVCLDVLVSSLGGSPNASKLMFTTLPLQHEPYRRLWQRFCRLEKWLELAARPSSEECPEEADLLAHEVDDISALRQRMELVQKELWSSLPVDFEDEHLEVRPSQLGVEAGLGLFATKALPANQLVVHYGGNIHTLKSSMKLQDQEYVMRLGQTASAVDELADGSLYVDAGPHLAVKGRYINDCRCSALMHDFDAYVASRVRNGTPLLPGSLDSYNLQLVCCPEKHVAELFTTRDVEEGEELFFDYGHRYWDDRLATGAVCKVLRKQIPIEYQ
ncbi:unnamed protein product [Cladocopium goreaui]|uniref:S-(Hydroxymethyl)glutathione dehydrogenase n=1 Tax=Cladocopium goreaui TaxID=2562237 RepID=A0A9P1D6P2_9DINO|nr:unnamed protein product [Cladocopium goreaui]